MLCYEIASHALLWFLKGKSFDLIAIVFLSVLVLVTVGLEVDNVLLMDQSMTCNFQTNLYTHRR